VGGLGFFFKLLFCLRGEGRLRKKKLHVHALSFCGLLYVMSYKKKKYKKKNKKKKKNGRATRRRLGRWGGSSAMRSHFVV